MHVAVLHPCFWPEVRRGAERIIRELSDGLLDRGQDVTLITSHRARRSRAVEDGLEVVRVYRPPQKPLLALGFEWYLTHVPFSYAALRRSDPEIAHAAHHVDGVAVARWGRLTGRPTVYTCMGIPDAPWLGRKRLRRQAMERSVRGCDAVVALSEAAARGLRDLFGRDVHAIPPGVDVAAFSPDESARSPVPEILCTATLEAPRKRVALLVEAFRRVRSELPDAQLVLPRPANLAGSAYLESEAGVRLETLDAGTGDRGALAAAYRRAWVCALPSTYEAFGLVLAEAMACGTPVVGTNTGGIPEVVGADGSLGVLFDGDDPATLAGALREAIELARDPATAARCRARAEELSTAATAERYAELYGSLRGEAAPVAAARG